MSLELFDPTAAPFLLSYVMLLAAAIAAGCFITQWLRPPGREQRVDDVDALAWLVGGRRRFREALVARLLAARTLIATGPRRFRIGLRPQAATPAEADLLRLRSPIRLRDIGDALGPHEEALERRMIAGGLLIDDAERARIRFWATFPLVAPIAFGATEWAAREAPASAALAALLTATALTAIIRWTRIDRRTRAGRSAVDKAQREAARLRSAPTREEAALAVALFGTGALVGYGWSPWRPARRKARGSDDGVLSDLFDGLMDMLDSARDWIGSGGSEGAGCGSGCGGGCGGG